MRRRSASGPRDRETQRPARHALLRGTPRPEGVGTRRPHADLEDVDDRQPFVGHASGARQRALRSRASSSADNVKPGGADHAVDLRRRSSADDGARSRPDRGASRRWPPPPPTGRAARRSRASTSTSARLAESCGSWNSLLFAAPVAGAPAPRSARASSRRSAGPTASGCTRARRCSLLAAVRQHLGLDRAAQHRVRRLQRADRRDGLGRLQVLDGEVRDADVAHLALLLQVGQRLPRFGDAARRRRRARPASVASESGRGRWRRPAAGAGCPRLHGGWTGPTRRA